MPADCAIAYGGFLSLDDNNNNQLHDWEQLIRLKESTGIVCSPCRKGPRVFIII